MTHKHQVARDESMSISELRRLTVSKYAAASVWKTPQALSGYLKSSLETYSAVEYEFYLRESEYLDGVVQLANALEFAATATGHTLPHLTVLEHASRFWSGWHAAIEADGLSAALRAAWLEVLRRLERAEIGSLCDGLPVIDYALNALVDPKVGPDAVEFQRVFADWLDFRNTTTHAVAVAAFLARVRGTENRAKVYSQSLARSAAFAQGR